MGIALHRLFLGLLLIIAVPVFSQTVISGKVTASSGEPLPGASVLLKDASSKIIAYAISGKAGAYDLQAKSAGNYILEVNFLGFKMGSNAITVTGSGKLVQNVTLQESGEVLQEVVIEKSQAVKRSGDTLIYNAKALSTGHEVVVEDLLKNIPGITIQKDGKIMYGNQEVEKVMVDGDDLFNKGYSLLTKNMPSHPLDKIEVLQNYSNNKHLKGIEDSNKVALNLTIDEKYKNIWFGDLALGYGTENRYKAHGDLMNFSKAYKNFLTFDLNNAGYDRVGNIEGMFNNSSDMETIGRSNSATKVMSMGQKVPRLDEDRTRFNNSRTAALSSILPIGSEAKLKVTGFLGFDKLNAYNQWYTVRDFETTYFVNTESNLSHTHLKKRYISGFFNYDISSVKMLQIGTAYSAGNNNFDNNYVFNGSTTQEALETRSTNFDQKLTYTYKWNSKNVVLIKGRFFTDKLPQYYTIDDYLLGNLFAYNNISALNNATSSSKEYAGLEADFKLKQKNDHLVAFVVGFENNNDNLASRFSLFTDNGIVNPEDFQSKSSYNVGDLYAKSGYTFKFNKFSIKGNLDMHQLFNRFENKERETKNQTPFFVNPTASFIWQIKPDNTLSGAYSYKVTNSSLLEVNNAYLLTSSRSFAKGLGNFNQLENAAANLNFTTQHYLNRYSFSWGLNYSKQNDVITYRSQIDQNSSLSQAFVMRGGGRLGASFKSHFVVKKLKSTLKLETQAGRTVYYNEVNNSGLRKNTAYTQYYSFGWTSNFKSAFNFNFNTDWNFSQVKSDNTFKNTSKYSFLDLLYTVKQNLTIKVKTEYYNFGGLNQYNNYFFADLGARYSFKKDKYSVSLDGRNLFNTNMFTTYNVSDLGYSTNSYRLLPRYIMVSCTFRF